MVLLLATACSGGGDDSSTTTEATTTTLLPASTTTTPSRIATEVDVCALLTEAELAEVLDDPGPGEATVTTPETEGAPPLLTGQCAWPSVDDAAFTLFYLGPTTADSGQQHLQDVLALEPEVFEAATVLPAEDIRNQEVSFLLDVDRNLRELAVVRRSALLYLVLDEDVSGTDPAVRTAYGDLLVSALIRAPR